MPPRSCEELIEALRDVANRISRHSAQHSALVCMMTAANAKTHPDEQANDLEMAGYPDRE